MSSLPRRLLVLASTYPRWIGDPEPGFVHELSRRLTDRFDVTVLCPHAPGSAVLETMDGVNIVRYRYAPDFSETLVSDGGIVTNLRRSKWKCLLVPGFVLSQAWQAWRLLRAESVDVVHAHWLLPQGLIAAALQLLPGRSVPYVVTSHGADLYALRGKMFDAVKRFVVNRSAGVTVVSGAMKDELARIGIAPGKIEVRSMGVDLSERFSPDPVARRSSDELLFVGRLVEKKGVQHLIDAMPVVLKARPEAFLTVAGFGPEEASLRNQVFRLGLEKAVRFRGAVPQEQLPALYRRAALFVAPFIQARSGDQEGLGLVLVEAIGCGCPILAGNVPAVADVLGDAVGEMTVDPRDTRALAQRVIAMLEDPVAARARASALRKRVIERFDWERVAEGYRQLLAKAI